MRRASRSWVAGCRAFAESISISSDGNMVGARDELQPHKALHRRRRRKLASFDTALRGAAAECTNHEDTKGTKNTKKMRI
jgi:hypothetical protein